MKPETNSCPALSPDSSVADAFDLFLKQPGRKLSTKKKLRCKLAPFVDKYGRAALDGITGELLEEWFAYLEEKRGYSEGNLAFHRNAFHAFFAWCCRFTGSNPAAVLPHYSARPRAVVTANESDLQAALAACVRLSLSDSPTARRDAAIFALGSTGLRRSNIEHCRLSDAVAALDNPFWHDGRDVFLLQTKGKEPMEATLTSQTAGILRRYLELRPFTRHDRLFVIIDTNKPNHGEPLSTEGFIRARRRVCKDAGVPLIDFKKMRRLIGTKVARARGVELAAQVLGHRSGVKVVIDHYYDPDKEAARLASLEAQLTTTHTNN